MTAKYQLGIVILQWNGGQDTIDCLRSLLPAIRNLSARLMIIDNGSCDDSTKHLRQYLRESGLNYCEKYSQESEAVSFPHDGNHGLTLLISSENLGFARGCNLGLRYLGIENYEWFLLLNNDTEVTPDCLENLLAMAHDNPQIDVWAPVITYYQAPHLIWDCGGNLTFWGDRTFPGRKKVRVKYPYRGYTQRTFLTGCALLVKAELFRSLGLLPEQFFFGEEDYYLACLLRQKRRSMAVCWEAEIRHKVATSIKRVSPHSIVPLAYIHNLNRLINMRHWLTPTLYTLWKTIYIPYAVFRLWWKNWIPLPLLIRFVALLNKNHKLKQEVTRADFYQAKDLFR